MNRVPKLRFPEFSGEWEEKELGGLVEINSGNSPTNLVNEIGKIPYFKVEQLNNSVKYQIRTPYKVDSIKKLIPKGSIIFPKRGASILLNKIRILAQDSYMDTNLMSLTPDSLELNNEFLYYFILKEDLSKIADTTSIPQINNKHIEPYIISMTKFSEQKEIASFLASVDNKIERLERKKELFLQYKKGMMQKIFSQKLRFKDEFGREYPEWEEKRLGDIGKFFSGGTPLTSKKEYYDGNIPFIKSGEIGKEKTEQFISQLGLENSSSKFVKTGDLLLALYGATSGEIAISKLDGAINQAVLNINTTENKYFLYNCFLLNKENILNTFLQGGQGNLSAEIIKNLKFDFPSLPEQTQIAEFLSSIDSKLELVDKELLGVKEFKKGLLQQMFV